MQFVIGLGNPGEEYASSRHNVGWMVLDALRSNLNAKTWTKQPKFKAEVSQLGPIWLLKPQTFMNASGLAVRAIIQFYDKSAIAEKEHKNVWVIHDDLDIPFGTYKIHYGKGPKVHNGLLSVNQELGSELFWHVRVGVDNRLGDRSMPGSSYVLQSFTPEEKTLLESVTKQIVSDLIPRFQVE